MDRRKRMHGRKRRSPAKMAVAWQGDGPSPMSNPIFAPQGENATNYNPEKQADRMQKMLQDAQLAARRYQMQNPYKGLSKGGNGAHSHSGRGSGGIMGNLRDRMRGALENYRQTGGNTPPPMSQPNSSNGQGEQVQGSDVLAAFTQAASPVAKKNKKKLKNKNKK